MEKTRSVDFARLTLRDALDLATVVEEESKERYGEFADQMDLHHNPEAARFFRYMLDVETKHEDRLAARRKKLFGEAPRVVRREMIFDIEAPEYDEVRATMSLREALEASLRAEKKACAFFEAALGNVKDADVRVLFTQLRDEEREHEALVEKELAKVPPEGVVKAEDVDDGPVAH